MWKVLLVFILGCGASDDARSVSAEPDAGVAPPPADAALPGVVSAGTWKYSTYTKTSDTCGNRVEGNDALTIDNVTPTSFRVTWPGTPRQHHHHEGMIMTRFVVLLLLCVGCADEEDPALAAIPCRSDCSSSAATCSN